MCNDRQLSKCTGDYLLYYLLLMRCGTIGMRFVTNTKCGCWCEECLLPATRNEKIYIKHFKNHIYCNYNILIYYLRIILVCIRTYKSFNNKHRLLPNFLNLTRQTCLKITYSGITIKLSHFKTCYYYYYYKLR
jgi:hypothetical protein